MLLLHSVDYAPIVRPGFFASMRKALRSQNDHYQIERVRKEENSTGY